jgi:hypothetical protein
MIRITAKRKEGFRRLGIFHPGEPTTFPCDRFTPDELAVLKAEPMLRVEIIDEPAAESATEPVAETQPEPAAEPAPTRGRRGR